MKNNFDDAQQIGPTMTDDSNRAQAEFWDEIAPAWATAEQHTELVAARFGDLAAERLELQPGQRVLDVGCGTGPTTLTLAGAVGPTGLAVGVDIAAGMIARASTRAAETPGVPARFAVADVQVDDIAGGPFDAVFSRFGVMFFADPRAAFTNIRALLRPGGRLAFACWADLFSNEWMFVPGAAVISVTGEFPAMPEPGAPGPFSLAEVDSVTALLAEAGFTEVDVTPHAEVVVLPESQVESIVALSRSVGPVREALLEADDELTAAILAGVREALADKVTNGELRLTAAANIVSGRG
jgi:SAM-dependent methyltransferase